MSSIVRHGTKKGLPKRERDIRRKMREVSTDVIKARRSLHRIGELTSARRKSVVTGYEDGLEIYDRVWMSEEDRLMNLRSAMVWCTRAENELRHIRAMLDRAIDLAEGDVL